MAQVVPGKPAQEVGTDVFHARPRGSEPPSSGGCSVGTRPTAPVPGRRATRARRSAPWPARPARPSGRSAAPTGRRAARRPGRPPRPRGRAAAGARTGSTSQKRGTGHTQTSQLHSTGGNDDQRSSPEVSPAATGCRDRRSLRLRLLLCLRRFPHPSGEVILKSSSAVRSDLGRAAPVNSADITGACDSVTGDQESRLCSPRRTTLDRGYDGGVALILAKREKTDNFTFGENPVAGGENREAVGLDNPEQIGRTDPVQGLDQPSAAWLFPEFLHRAG